MATESRESSARSKTRKTKKRASEYSRHHDDDNATDSRGADTASAPAAAVGGAWERFTSPDGRTYYYNKETQESRWKLPKELRNKSDAAPVSATPASAATRGRERQSSRSSAKQSASSRDDGVGASNSTDEHSSQSSALGAPSSSRTSTSTSVTSSSGGVGGAIVKKSAMFERLQASLAGRINPMAALGGGPPPMIRIPRGEPEVVVTSSSFSDSVSATAASDTAGEQQSDEQEALDAETAHMSAAERLRYLRKKRLAKAVHEDDFMQEFARNMEKKASQVPSVAAVSGVTDGSIDGSGAGSATTAPLTRVVSASVDWRKKREAEREARELALVKERAAKEKARAEREAEEAKRRRETEEREAEVRERETQRRREMEECEAEARVRQEQESVEAATRADVVVREEGADTPLAHSDTRRVSSDDVASSDEAIASEQQTVEGDDAHSEDAPAPSDARAPDTESKLRDETAVASLDEPHDAHELAENDDDEKNERRRRKEEKRARRRAAQLEAEASADNSGAASESSPVEPPEPSVSPVRSKSKSRRKRHEHEQDDEDNASRPPTSAASGHSPHAAATAPTSSTAAAVAMVGDANSCTCCRPHPFVPMHVPPPYPLHYPYAQPSPLMVPPPMVPPPMLMMAYPPPAPMPPMFYPPPLSAPPSQLGMVPTSLVPYMQHELAVYGNNSGGGAYGMGAAPVVLDQCEGCRGRGVGLVEKNGFCHHCNRLRLDFIVASARMRQRCSSCGGWGLGLVDPTTGKCAHCSSLSSPSRRQSLVGAIATPLAHRDSGGNVNGSRVGGRAPSAKRVTIADAHQRQLERQESFDWDQSSDGGSDWDD